VLTFLAGLDVDPVPFGRGSAPRSASASSPSLVRFIVASPRRRWPLLDRTLKASLTTGTALSTTSLAVIYAVLVEDGLNKTALGKLLMSATFVTDMGTAIALSAIFIQPNIWFPAFLLGSIALVVALPRVAPWSFSRYGDRVIEPEIKLVFVCLFPLMVLADVSNGHAVLPAFILGLARPPRRGWRRSDP
jgi:Kef-type K+ transport system membrane component KefB